MRSAASCQSAGVWTGEMLRLHSKEAVWGRIHRSGNSAASADVGMNIFPLKPCGVLGCILQLQK